MADAIKQLRFVAFREGEGWVAQCVDYDICTQGVDLTQARRRMNVALRCEAEFTADKHGKAFAGLDPAPDYFAAMYDAAESALVGDVDMRIAA
jgi:hypothetical protein